MILESRIKAAVLGVLDTIDEAAEGDDDLLRFLEWVASEVEKRTANLRPAPPAPAVIVCPQCSGEGTVWHGISRRMMPCPRCCP